MADHPDLERLLAYVDGELPEPVHARTAAHLRKCGTCGVELARLTVALVRAAAPPDCSPPDVERVLAGIDAWRATAPDEAVVRRRVVDELTPYVGQRAAEAVIARAAAGGGNLLAAVEQVLVMFLGGAAAERLMTQIVEEAIVRT